MFNFFTETGICLQHSKEGFDKSAIEASLNSLEFRLREFNTGGFPRGLSFMLSSLSRFLLSYNCNCLGQKLTGHGLNLGSWLYDRDPLEPLRFEEPLARLRSRLAAGEPVFENLIKKYLLENGHKVSVKVIYKSFSPRGHVLICLSGTVYSWYHPGA